MQELGGLASHTIVDWHSFIRDLTISWCESQEGMIGGLDENGNAITVEIDETVIRRRKYNRVNRIFLVVGAS